MSDPGETTSYPRHVTLLLNDLAHAEAMAGAVGGDFESVGMLERELLIQHGLQPSDVLIDVGCGSGRLSKALAATHEGPYLGIDVVPELLAHARELTKRPDWRFEISDGSSIPEQDDGADFVSFFSVLTHLPHEQSYQYLAEARRVLRPGGTIVFSFLEFRIPEQWSHFEFALSISPRDRPPIVFLSRDAIEAWSSHLQLEVVAILDGNVPHIPIEGRVEFQDGSFAEGRAKLGPVGQSVCILRRPQ